MAQGTDLESITTTSTGIDTDSGYADRRLNERLESVEQNYAVLKSTSAVPQRDIVKDIEQRLNSKHSEIHLEIFDFGVSLKKLNSIVQGLQQVLSDVYRNYVNVA